MKRNGRAAVTQRRQTAVYMHKQCVVCLFACLLIDPGEAPHVVDRESGLPAGCSSDYVEVLSNVSTYLGTYICRRAKRSAGDRGNEHSAVKAMCETLIHPLV